MIVNSPERKDQRRKDAQVRAEQRGLLTPQQQIDRLDKRLGAGVGAKKERAKLTKLIEAAQKK